jgi:hypothetical protein
MRLRAVSKTFLYTRLDVPAGVWLQGLDGLSRVRDGLIAVQIGPKPERVLRIRLDPQGTRIKNVEILEMSHLDYEGLIQGTVSGNGFLYVPNSQVDLGKRARLPQTAPTR